MKHLFLSLIAIICLFVLVVPVQAAAPSYGSITGWSCELGYIATNTPTSTPTATVTSTPTATVTHTPTVKVTIPIPTFTPVVEVALATDTTFVVYGIVKSGDIATTGFFCSRRLPCY